MRLPYSSRPRRARKAAVASSTQCRSSKRRSRGCSRAIAARVQINSSKSAPCDRAPCDGCDNGVAAWEFFSRGSRIACKGAQGRATTPAVLQRVDSRTRRLGGRQRQQEPGCRPVPTHTLRATPTKGRWPAAIDLPGSGPGAARQHRCRGRRRAFLPAGAAVHRGPWPRRGYSVRRPPAGLGGPPWRTRRRLRAALSCRCPRLR